MHYYKDIDKIKSFQDKLEELGNNLYKKHLIGKWYFTSVGFVGKNINPNPIVEAIRDKLFLGGYKLSNLSMSVPSNESQRYHVFHMYPNNIGIGWQVGTYSG